MKRTFLCVNTVSMVAVGRVVIGMAVLALAGPAVALAQQNATTVQLPTFSFFSVSTTVLAPDSGAGYAAGMSRAAHIYPTYGHPAMRNHGLANYRSASGMSIAVQVHDLRWMDEMLLGRVVINPTGQDEKGLAARSSFAQQVANASDGSGEDADAFGAMHVNDIRRARDARRLAEVNELVAKGEQSLAKGSTTLAQYYFKQAASKASGEMQSDLLRRVAALDAELQQAKDRKAANKKNGSGGR